MSSSLFWAFICAVRLSLDALKGEDRPLNSKRQLETCKDLRESHMATATLQTFDSMMHLCRLKLLNSTKMSSITNIYSKHIYNCKSQTGTIVLQNQCSVDFTVLRKKNENVYCKHTLPMRKHTGNTDLLLFIRVSNEQMS